MAPFTEEHQLFRQSLREFLDREVVPHIDAWEEAGRTTRDIWKKMGDMGFLGLGFPKAYGGLELDFFYDVIFCEEVSQCFSGGFAINPVVVQYMSAPYIVKYGSDTLKERLLPGIVAGETITSIGITEPGAGSDVANIRTTAVRDGDHYVVNGAKTFITNAVYGDYIVTVVKTDPDKGTAGVSLLVIPRQAEGVSARSLKKLGWHASDTAELNFDNVRVPADFLLGQEGQGFYYLMGGLQLERLVGAVMGYAASDQALRYALGYMGEREAFGRPINKFQVLRHRVAQLASEIEATRQFVRYCAGRHAAGEYVVKECSMAKLLATELSDKVMYQCLQFFGGYGFMEEYKIARMFRDSRVGTIGGGTSEIMREIIAKMVIDEVAYAGAQGSGTDVPPSAEGQGDGGGKDLIGFLERRFEGRKPLGKTLKFALDSGPVYIDGTGAGNAVRAEDAAADCTVTMSRADFDALVGGTLNPMEAVMSGRLVIDGDMGVAMKLQGLFAG
jgi:acyl-CoA dehydrogenase